MTHTNWEGFRSGAWQNEINVRDFIQTNYTPPGVFATSKRQGDGVQNRA